MSIKKFAQVLSVSALALGFAFVGGNGASAQSADTSVVIHKADCHAGVGSAIFEECHDNPVEGVVFGIAIESGEADAMFTDADGHAGWEWVGGGSVVLVEEPQPEGYVGAYAYCRDLVSDEVLYDGSVVIDEEGFAVLGIETEPGMEVVCDWYNIAADGSHVPADGPSHMPNTGAGIMAGGSAPFAAMIATGLVALAGAAALRRRVA